MRITLSTPTFQTDRLSSRGHRGLPDLKVLGTSVGAAQEVAQDAFSLTL
jgi:hypothetical protein